MPDAQPGHAARRGSTSGAATDDHVLIDTHVLAWSLVDPSLLGSEAHAAFTRGTVVHVPPCAFHEITLKVRKGKWDEMLPHADRFDALAASQGFHVAPYTARMAMRAGSLD